MKIITGVARGMNLETLSGDATRPTSQRVKEAIFSMLQFDIDGAVVLDLFAGCGQMGLEALSRGASKAVFCDISRESTELIIRNAKKTKLFDKCRVSNCDYKQMLRGISGKEKYDIVFIDPPYKKGAVAEVLDALLKANALNRGAFVVCESVDENVFDNNELLPDKFEIYKKARYSISHVTILKPKVEE